MRSVVLLLLFQISVCVGEELARQEFPTNYAPAPDIRAALEEVLSPEGRFVVLGNKGKVLVIDRAAHLKAASEALSAMDSPNPEVQLSLGVRTGGQRRPSGNTNVLGPVQSRSSFPFPTEFDPPRILVGPNGTYAVIPAHPKNFQRRNLGVTMETDATINPDGSINLSINREDVEFQGFINYGSPILSLGNAASMPILNQTGNPMFFAPFITENKILVPIFETTRIATSVVVYPQLQDDFVRLHLLPELSVSEEEMGWKNRRIQLREFRTVIDLQNGKVATLSGFTGAPKDFGEHFFSTANEADGATQIVLKAQVRPAKSPEKREQLKD
tara:strand:+ start:28611 stop:29597 length:987 start_codon:yes stop_codon:yes gene_type:complete